MNREQMIAWLALEGWVYVRGYDATWDGFIRENKGWGICGDRQRLFGIKSTARNAVDCNLPTADIAMFIAHVSRTLP